MNITPEELKELAGNGGETSEDIEMGPQQIVVVDRGFVFVGKCSLTRRHLVIHNARNIRYWGTTEGLGQLVDGPTNKTKLDHFGEVRVPHRAVIFTLKCNRDW